LTRAVEQFETVVDLKIAKHWRATVLPKGWGYVADFGIRQDVPEAQSLSSNISLREDNLRVGETLAAYIQAQAKLLERYLASPKMAGPQTISFNKADEASLFLVRHIHVEAGPMIHAQTYLRFGSWIGIMTLTTPEFALSTVRPDYDAFLRGLQVVLGE
jgi:hypothetical protein